MLCTYCTDLEKTFAERDSTTLAPLKDVLADEERA